MFKRRTCSTPHPNILEPRTNQSTPPRPPTTQNQNRSPPPSPSAQPSPAPIRNISKHRRFRPGPGAAGRGGAAPAPACGAGPAAERPESPPQLRRLGGLLRSPGLRGPGGGVYLTCLSGKVLVILAKVCICRFDSMMAMGEGEKRIADAISWGLARKTRPEFVESPVLTHEEEKRPALDRRLGSNQSPGRIRRRRRRLQRSSQLPRSGAYGGACCIPGTRAAGSGICPLGWRNSWWFKASRSIASWAGCCLRYLEKLVSIGIIPETLVKDVDRWRASTGHLVALWTAWQNTATSQSPTCNA